MSKPSPRNANQPYKPSASFNKKTRSRLAELAAQKKAKADDLEQVHPVPTEEEMKQALSNIFEGLSNGIDLQQILGLSDYLLEEIYTVAYTFYSQGKYNEAVGLFQLLAAAQPQNYKYMLGLSSCYHQLHLYNEAAFGFFLAFDAQPQNPIPPYYIADSLLKLQQPEESSNFLDITMDICGNNPEFKILKERCQIMKQSIDKQMAGENKKSTTKKPATKNKTTAKKKSGKKH
ncbi:SycD/LcrH family type III secretion system chaperone [Candidatus Chlamydia corallus]|uniref:SycD/LcrH family type III secretion system chaperone n=1 Tax=Candidatus Chlamydia corallus TaxID=2038470 RepID=UPI000C2FC433|nr:SycD/LcrH family type III secretion system chaperone [Candidatus Chlamydia corallus]